MSDHLIDSLPPFPALESCLIIDSRHAYRVELHQKLKSTLLFEVLREPETLEQGMRALRTELFDACIVGASVARGKASPFIEEARGASRSKDCAFVRFRNTDPASLSEPPTNAHLELSWPCTRRTLFDSMVHAVIAANASSPWSALAKKYEIALPPSDQVIALAGAFRVDETTRVRQPTVTDTPTNGAGEPGGMSDLVKDLCSSSGSLGILAEGLRTGRYRLDIKGNPTKTTLEAITAVVEKLSDGKRDGPLYSILLDLLRRWSIDFVQQGPAPANRGLKENLQKKLLG